MFSDAEWVLQKIGSDLDNHIYPLVVSGGIVMPSSSTTPTPILGVEQNHEYSRQERPPTRAWKRSQGWQRATSGSRPRPTGHTAPVISELLREQYLAELDIVCSCYTNMQYWVQDEGIWLLFESQLLPGYSGKAIFAVAIPFVETVNPRAWAFWSGAKWIGPRHTNFPDGSICAFEPSDLTWSLGDPILNLLDLYILWAIRHLHLAFYDRWPGQQSVHHIFERINELRDDEYCGCGSTPIKLYRDCCKAMDKSVNQVTAAVNFVLSTGGRRTPPNSIISFVNGDAPPPNFTEWLV